VRHSACNRYDYQRISFGVNAAGAQSRQLCRSGCAECHIEVGSRPFHLLSCYGRAVYRFIVRMRINRPEVNFLQGFHTSLIAVLDECVLDGNWIVSVSRRASLCARGYDVITKKTVAALRCRTARCVLLCQLITECSVHSESVSCRPLCSLTQPLFC
jgi:hypothetical protein